MPTLVIAPAGASPGTERHAPGLTHREADVRREVALDLDDTTQGALVEDALRRPVRRLPPALVTDGEDDAGSPGRPRWHAIRPPPSA
jgi:hypothetical protein